MTELHRMKAKRDQFDHDHAYRAKKPAKRYNLQSEGSIYGFNWYTAHNDMGFRNGYITVGKGHPWFGLDWTELSGVTDAPGGVTWAKKGPPRGVPRFSYTWWIGFDCGHAGDGIDLELVSTDQREDWRRVYEKSDGKVDIAQTMRQCFDGHVWTLDEVNDACIALCADAATAKLTNRVETVSYGSVH